MKKGKSERRRERPPGEEAGSSASSSSVHSLPRSQRGSVSRLASAEGTGAGVPADLRSSAAPAVLELQPEAFGAPSWSGESRQPEDGATARLSG